MIPFNYARGILIVVSINVVRVHLGKIFTRAQIRLRYDILVELITRIIMSNHVAHFCVKKIQYLRLCVIV